MSENAKNWSAWFSRFSTFRQLTLDIGVFIRSMESPDCEDIKIAMQEVPFCSTWFTPSFGGFWGHRWPLERLKKKLRNWLSLSETDPLNYKRLDFRDLVGVGIAPVSKKIPCWCDILFNLYLARVQQSILKLQCNFEIFKGKVF